jgi:thiamine-monophosphate kinase
MVPAGRSARPGEFEAIARWFAPLAEREPGALGLTDDAAVLAPAPGNAFVLTVDMLVAGVHFLPDDPPDLVARKLLRVNLSDLAAMGAVPRAYFLAVALPRDVDAAWFDAFAAGLAADQREFGVTLAGGDTTGTPGPLTLSLTALGELPVDTAVRRSGAHAGDEIYVSGTIGDAALALEAIAGRAAVPDAAARDHLIGRYRLPTPRTTLGPALRGLASAMIDVSDGLLADLGHICETSSVAAEVDFAAVPLSPAAAALLAADPALAGIVVSGGDDYELLFTAPPAARAAIAALAARTGVPATRIGAIAAGQGVTLRDAAGRALTPARAGWQHF